jgi:hypothetical protein
MGQIRVGHAVFAISSLLLAMILCWPSLSRAATFSFSTGNPDGKMAMASRPDFPGKPEIEAADDFVLTDQAAITHATFTGVLPESAAVNGLVVEIYRVFPLDSNALRTPAVPTRMNSPSDVAFQSRSSSDAGQLRFSHPVIASSFTAANSVLNGIHPSPSQTTNGEGPVTGREERFSVTLLNPIVLPAGHYFFVPQVQLSGTSPQFFWLSAPRPIVAPGTPFPPGQNDLQAWIRNSALDPDWLRVGTDIVGGATPPTFNAAFTLDNAPLPFGSTVESLKRGIGVQLNVKAPAAGKVRAFDPQVGKRGHKTAWFNAVTANATRAGVVHLRVVPNATGLRQLAPRASIRLLVRVTFTPPGGQPSARTISITWRRK